MAKSPEMRAHAAAEVCRARFSDRRAAPRARDVVSPFPTAVCRRGRLCAPRQSGSRPSRKTQNSTRHHPRPPRALVSVADGASHTRAGAAAVCARRGGAARVPLDDDSKRRRVTTPPGAPRARVGGRRRVAYNCTSDGRPYSGEGTRDAGRRARQGDTPGYGRRGDRRVRGRDARGASRCAAPRAPSPSFGPRPASPGSSFSSRPRGGRHHHARSVVVSPRAAGA